MINKNKSKSKKTLLSGSKYLLSPSVLKYYPNNFLNNTHNPFNSYL